MARKPDKQTAKNGRDPKTARTEKGRFAPGGPGGPGRPAGVPNSFSAQVKADLLEAYYERGGKAYLAGLPDSLFVRLLTIVLPRESTPKTAEPDMPQLDIRVDVLDLLRASIGADVPKIEGDYLGAHSLPVIEADAVDGEIIERHGT